MKRSLIIMTLFALCLIFNQAHAQRYLPGMKALQGTAYTGTITRILLTTSGLHTAFTPKMQIAGFSAGNTSKNDTIIRT